MSRLAKTVVTEREQFVRELFQANPALTGKEVQDKLKEKFNKMMRPNRIYELKREVTGTALATTPSETVTQTQPETPAPTTTPVEDNALKTALAESVGLMQLIHG